MSVFPQQKSLQVEQPYSRAVNDRKRKLVETELAQDTEGNFNLMNMTNACLADGSDYWDALTCAQSSLIDAVIVEGRLSFII